MRRQSRSVGSSWAQRACDTLALSIQSAVCVCIARVSLVGALNVRGRDWRYAWLVVTVTAALFGSFVSPALAVSPWWHLTSGSRPTSLQHGARGEVVVTLADLGDAVANGETSPITIIDKLPAGLRAVGIEGVAGEVARGFGNRGPVTCSQESLTCTFASVLPTYEQIEVRIKVEILNDASSGDVNEVSVSGGGAPSVSIVRPIAISDSPTPFGVEEYEIVPEEEGGALDTRAGSHPFQLTTTLTLKQTAAGNIESGNNSGAYMATPAALLKDVNVKLPPGLVGNPNPFPRCTMAQFTTVVVAQNACPRQTAVGVAMLTIVEQEVLGFATVAVPIFNLEPAFGEPARFGFFLPEAPVLLDTSVRSGPGEDYGVTVSSLNTTQTADLISSKVTFWGVPGDPRHDSVRGWGCMYQSRGREGQGVEGGTCSPTVENHPPSLLTLPISCADPLQPSVEVDSWALPSERLLFPDSLPLPALDACNQLAFTPAIGVSTTTDGASSPSGLDFNVDFHDEGLTSGTGRAQSQLKDTVVTLPEGFTINPSAGVGLGGCTPADYERETVSSLPGAGCPNDSKLGTVEIETPLLTQKIHGSLFIAQPYENPFPEPAAGHPDGTLIAIYIVAKNPETGILVKLAGKVVPNPVTGQLTTAFWDNPQLPFDHFNFHFREGQQAPLITPATCGTYSVQAQMTPWSAPTTTLTDTSSFTITKGFDGGACPTGGLPPFKPGIASGTLNNDAGAFSPFYLHLTRTDAEQEISGFSTNMPPGLTGDLTGIPFCPEAGIEAARHKTGREEEALPSCPAASQIGHTLVGTGVGAVLAYVPGKLYLAGPFHGAPFSLVSVTSAVVGPFDLGTVVLRFGLSIDPTTAQVNVTPTGSEPIPTIIDGIVTHVRDIRVYVDRPNFILNPTSCDPMAISSTLNSDLGHSSTVSSRFQATNCASLAFKPSFKVSTAGKTSRKNGASLHVRLTMSGALGTNANIKYVKVALPRQLPSNLKTIQQACPDHVFEANPANCSAASRIGTATTTTPILPVPLSGPVYFVSHAAREFPDLVAVLQGYGVTIDLRGRTFIAKNGQTTTTFETVPDAPVGVFEMDLPQGPFSALAAPNGVCKGKLYMPTRMIAQNGAVFTQKTKIKTAGCPKAKKKKKHGKGKRKK